MIGKFSEKASDKISEKRNKIQKKGKTPKKAEKSERTRNEGNSVIPSALKGIGIGLGITCIIFAICALVLTYTDIDESCVGIVSTISTALSAAAAGYVTAKSRGKAGLITGVAMGVIYGFILILISAAAGGNISMNNISFIITASAGGGIGGILGVNAR